jgi:DNA-binding CsgD family transcriptional regulator
MLPGKQDYLKEAEALLTKREFEVYTLLISGKTDMLISEALFISLHTIKTHNRNIYKKLKVSNRVELIQKITAHNS